MPVPWGAAPDYMLPKFPRPRIAEAKDRAMTLRQLRELREFVKRLCKVALIEYPDDVNKKRKASAKHIPWNDFNQHDITRAIIKKIIPQETSCSWVEFASLAGAQPRRFFCSHSWNEPFRDFMAAIEHHSFEYGVGLHDGYWLCVYAIDQWNIDLGESLECSPFYSALSGAESTLLMLDREFDVMSRVWVIYELYHTVTLEQRLDVGTPLGLMGTALVSSGPFVEALKSLKSSTATCSDPADRRSIFNKITGCEEKHGLILQAGRWVLNECDTFREYEKNLVQKHEAKFRKLDAKVQRMSLPAHELAVLGARRNSQATRQVASSSSCYSFMVGCRTPLLAKPSSLVVPHKSLQAKRTLQAWRRGVTLAQLRAFTQKVKAACSREDWVEQRKEMPRYGKRLAWDEVTWVHSRKYYVKPKTSEQNCSYMELEIEKPQPPVYFVNFRWGLTVKETMAAIERVAEARQLRDTTVLWIDQLATAESEEAKPEVMKTPTESSMYEAIRECNGVIIVVSKSFDPLRKTWGMFALHAAKELAKSVDLTCLSGALATTRPFMEGCWEWGNFSAELAGKLSEIRLTWTAASMPEDKRLILNHVAQLDAGAEPPSENQRYDDLDAHLHRSVSGPILRKMAHDGDERILAAFIEEAKLNVGSERLRGVFGETALHVAASSGHTVIVNLLLEEGVSINVQDFDGETPLHHAVLAMKDEMVMHLLDLNADAKLESYYSENSEAVAKQKFAGFLGAECDESCQQILENLENVQPLVRRTVTSNVRRANLKFPPQYSPTTSLNDNDMRMVRSISSVESSSTISGSQRIESTRTNSGLQPTPSEKQEWLFRSQA